MPTGRWTNAADLGFGVRIAGMPASENTVTDGEKSLLSTHASCALWWIVPAAS